MTYHPFLFNPILTRPIPHGHYDSLDEAITRIKKELSRARPECWGKVLNQNYDIIWDSRKQNDKVA